MASTHIEQIELHQKLHIEEKKSDNTGTRSVVQIYKAEDLVDFEAKDGKGNVTICKKLRVGVRFEITEITSIDTQTQRYGIKGQLKQYWKASERDLKTYLTDPTNYEPEVLPVYSFLNSVEVVEYSTEPIRITQKHNYQLIEYTMIFTEEFEIANFPFDVQSLSAVLKLEGYEKQVTFGPPPEEIFNAYIRFDKTWFSITDWEMINVDLTIFEVKSVSGPTVKVYEILVFRLQVKRKWKGVIYRLVLWLLFLGMMSCATFGISSEDIGDRLSYSITMALTIVAFQFIISDRLPKVNYMTLLDKYNLFIFGLVLFITIETTIVGYGGEGLIANAAEIDTDCGRITMLVFGLGNVLFFIYAIYVNKKENLKKGKWNPVKRNVFRRYNTDTIRRVEFS